MGSDYRLIRFASGDAVAYHRTADGRVYGTGPLPHADADAITQDAGLLEMLDYDNDADPAEWDSGVVVTAY